MRPKRQHQYQSPSTGKLLVSYFDRKRINRAALSRKLNLSIGSVLNYQKNDTIQSALLWDISVALNHNFFMDLAVKMPKEFTTEADLYTEKNKKIAELEQEILILKVERDLLLKVTGVKN
jgi:hypothetical protein